jgi:outer membrane protein assembly complex protein YaeT
MEQDLKESFRGEGFFNVSTRTSIENQGSATVYRIDVIPGTKYEAAHLVFQGQSSLSTESFEDRLRSLYLSRNEMISEAIHRFPEISKKISALYAEQGFLNARARRGRTNFDSKEESVEVEIMIEEGPRTSVSALALTEGRQIPQDLLANLSLTTGQVYLPMRLNQDANAILQYYKTRGYWNVRAKPVVEPLSGSPDVVIRYDFDPGVPARIQSVEIRGRRVTREGMIRKELKLKEGDLITEELLSEAQDRLYALEVFESIGMHLEESGEPGNYNVVVEVVEDKKYELSYGGRYDSEDDFEAEAQLADHNFLGTAQGVFVYGRFNRHENRYQLGYSSPSILGWNWNAFFLGERVNLSDLDIVQTNFTFQQQNDLPGLFEIQSGYKYTRNVTTLIDPIEGTPEEFIIGISRLQATVYADYRDNPINATRGFFVSTGLEYAPDFLGSFQTFLKSYSQFYYYRNVSRFTLASGVRVGLASTFEQEFLLTPERFFAGGRDTLRGFKFEEVGPRDEIFDEPLGGEAVLILNAEARFPIYKWFGGVLFFDTGNVYEDASDFSFDLRHSAGFGLRVLLPYGILGRFDIGLNLDPLENEPRTVFHFGIGQAF